MVSHRTFWLADGRGHFVGGGPQDSTGRAGTFLGNMLDTSITWAPQAGYFRHTTFEMGYTRFFNGSYPILIECHKALGRPMSIMSNHGDVDILIPPLVLVGSPFPIASSFQGERVPFLLVAGTKLDIAQGAPYEIAQRRFVKKW